MMNKFKTAAASVLAAAMILSLTACDEEPAVSGSNSGVSNAEQQHSTPTPTFRKLQRTQLTSSTIPTLR